MRLETVERRFGNGGPPHSQEMPRDQGSCRNAGDTRIFARPPGLGPRCAPVERKQVDGVAEAVAKPLTRDEVQVTPPPDAVTIHGLIAGGIEDRNDAPPHQGLTMPAPRERLAGQTATA